MDNDDYLDDEDVSTVWFYFDGNGKAVGYGKDQGAIKKINYGDGSVSGYFIFNTDGVMLSGWQEWDGNTYYLGDENQGWALTGWQYLDTDDELFDGGDDNGDPYESEEWFYFDSKGKAQKSKNKQIGGRWYAFDSNGVMLDLWVYGTGSAISNSEGSSSMASQSGTAAARYHEEDNGWRDKNWVMAYANTNYDDYDEDMYWFYLNNNGTPVRAEEGVGYGEEVTDSNKAYDGLVAKSIKNKTYIFDAAGRMQTGLFKLENVKKGSSATPMDGYFYFTEDEGSTEGQMVTNKKVTVEIDGEDETYYFKKNGEAYVATVISGSLYGNDGALVTDYGDGSTYQMIDGIGYDFYTEKSNKESSMISGEAMILVNGNGKIKKSGTVTDMDGLKVTVKDYVVTKIVDENKTVIYEAE